jgi:crossover junction endodeoxyribonuclease RuvC
MAAKKLWPHGAHSRTLSVVTQSLRTDGNIFRVLGVDPAAAGATGYGIIESDGRHCRMIRFGALRATRKGPEHFPERLREIHEMLSNLKTALKLAEVRGVVLLTAAQRNIPVHSYSPREIKACVAGYGHAGKEQMQLMVRALLGMSETPEPADAADALAVALCHIQAAQFRARLEAGAARVASVRVPVNRGTMKDDPIRPVRSTHSRSVVSRIPVIR